MTYLQIKEGLMPIRKQEEDGNSHSQKHGLHMNKFIKKQKSQLTEIRN